VNSFDSDLWSGVEPRAQRKEFPMGNPVVHFEFWSQSPEKVSSFYEKLFGWQIRHDREIDYLMVDTQGQGGINGGIMKPAREGPWPAKLCFYIAVDELALMVKKVRDAGGKIHVERQEVPNLGEFALFEDPDGRVLGLWKTYKT
jgi:predicted enzyme related to lactoylglutathione lyase